MEKDIKDMVEVVVKGGGGGLGRRVTVQALSGVERRKVENSGVE